MSGRPNGRRLQSGVSSGSQQDIRIKPGRRERESDRSLDDDRGGSGDSRGGRTDEVRISKLARGLAKLESEKSFFTISNQIESALQETENRRYVGRYFSCLCPSFQEVFKGLPGLSWEASATKRYAQLLSKICRGMDTRNHVNNFFQWLVEIITRTSKGSQSQISPSAYSMEAVSLHLIGHLDYDAAATFVNCAYVVLEDIVNPRVFLVLGSIFVQGTNYTSATWRNPHFHDFIDLVVGWMVDVRQSGQFSGCAELLEKSKDQFMKDPRFLCTLMSQILEDLEQAIKKVQPEMQSDCEEFQKVLQLMRAFTVMMTLECPLDKLALTEFCDRLVASTLQFIRMTEPHQTMDRKYRYELLSTVNQSLFFSGGVLTQSVTKYFRAQLKLGVTNASYVRWPKLFLGGFLESFTVWVEAAVSQTQLNEDITEICETILSLIEDMKQTLPPHDHHYVLNLIVALLRTRNVTLMQKVYVWLIAQLPAKREKQSESVEEDSDCLFVLAGLTDLINNKNSSILSLWALEPALFQLLVDVTDLNIHPRTVFCTMELLKTHCCMHSHFVSSIASTGSFNADSPGSRFLPSLMDFWLRKLKTDSEVESKWMVDWIFEFLQSNSSYASMLYELKPDFYHRFLEVITSSSAFLPQAAKILEWFTEDLVYSKLEKLSRTIQERIVLIVLDEKIPDRIKTRFKLLIYQMTTVLVVPDSIFTEDCVEPAIVHEDVDGPKLALTSTEFNLFLHELLVGNSHDIPQFTSTTNSNCLSAAADHLIRVKLKTPLGKPQDFFGQLLLVFKRSRSSKIPVARWKLHFVFELEKKFHLWTHGSALDETELTEHVKQFYSMNKSPFLEWLKRIRSEIIETCLVSKELSLAYFNAALTGNSQKMESVLYRTNDHIGILGMGNIAAHYYLEGRYEDALKELLKNHEDTSSHLSEEIQKSSEEMVNDSYHALRKWQDIKSGSLETIIGQLENSSLYNLLDLQLGNKRKVNLSVVGDADGYENMRLHDLQKIHILLKTVPEESVDSEKIEKLERIRIDKMLESNNLEYVRRWLLEKQIDLKTIHSDEDLSNLPLSTVPFSVLKVCADFYFQTADYCKSALLYNILKEIASMDSEFTHKVTASLTNKIMGSDPFFKAFSAESLSHCNKIETIKSLHEVTLQSFPDCAKSWLSYGNFLYSATGKRSAFYGTDIDAMKSTSVDCYSKYIQLGSPQKNISTDTHHISCHNPRVVVMTRLLELFRNGYHFNCEEVILTPEWLVLLAEISQIPEMRAHLIEKFPDQASLFLTSHDASISLNKRTPRRRNLFDLSPYSYVDTSEEPLSSSVLLSNLNQLEKQDTNNSQLNDTLEQFQFRSELKIQPCATVFAKELLRLASSMQDMWVWSLERIAVDWGRRTTYLRKECLRSLSTEKIQAYVKPIVIYLEELLAATQESENDVDINFLNNHRLGVNKYLEGLLSSCTVDEVSSTMHSLMKYSNDFGKLLNNRLPLELFSKKLSNPEFYTDSSFDMCLPGQPPHLKICSVHPIIHALPTKTKPKRVRILASNGKYYDYLVKGTENLNIDCGVMQFMNISQSFFNQNTRTYSVIPLGKRGGLIQIVPDAIPLFTLYKKHLQRNKTLEKTSDIFWQRLNSFGYEDRSSSTGLREVFESLSSETSSDLVTRELLLSASTPSQWLESVQTFTRDCSIGSAIGYILGIGDRHLDNMLVNASKGKFIHVDFTIIFGRGASLRVPEKVPFRLTQNLQKVLQDPGPSGAFSVIMQNVLTAYQEYRETAAHLVKNIAFTHMYDEDSPVDLTKIMLSEVDSAIRLFGSRSSQYLSMLQTLRNEIANLMDDTDSLRKISRKLNRWRRMLVNLNTVLQFIITSIHSTPRSDKFKYQVQNQWKRLFQTSLESGMDIQSLSTNAFLKALDETESIIKNLQMVLLEACNELSIEMLRLEDTNVQVIDKNKVEILVKFAEMNIQTFTSTTVRKLIDEATSVDNLSQMYEGWTPWV